MRLLGCCVALLPHSSNVSTHAQSTEAIRQFRCLRAVRQDECWLRRDCGVESNTRASLISIYESGDSYVSTGCNTRVTTNDSKKGWNRSWRFRASVSIHILGHAANRKTRRHRAHLHPRKARTAAKVPYTQRDQQFGKKSPQKASLTQKAQGC